ncbi:hypothetical protein C8R44DRAFT_821967 [Mycena epipterygia]|nr:hypothetical protein C8R44DRAFT_821967 [Mycena epipterygia]
MLLRYTAPKQLASLFLSLYPLLHALRIRYRPGTSRLKHVSVCLLKSGSRQTSLLSPVQKFQCWMDPIPPLKGSAWQVLYQGAPLRSSADRSDGVQPPGRFKLHWLYFER